MKVAIDTIKVKRRARKDIREIEELAESIRRNGLLNPIIIDENNVLIAGERRLRAMKHLGRKQIEANIISVENSAQALEIEIEENTQRQEFTQEELLEAYTKLNKIRNPGALVRFWRWLKALFRKIFKRNK